MDDPVDVPLALDKLPLRLIQESNSSSGDPTRCQKLVVLVSTGSFNPPTYMHLRMFELAKDALSAEGYVVIGGYMSPVNDAYKKKGLISAAHRVRLCELACKSSSFIMVDPWEAKHKSYQRTLFVLSRIHGSLCKGGFIKKGQFVLIGYTFERMPFVYQELLKIMLLCGSDLLESFSTPGVWIPEQVRTICRDFGVICVRREGKDIGKIISSDGILSENQSNIIVVDEVVPNQISSSRVRDCVRRGLSVKYLTSDEVIQYISDQQLYLESED